MSRRTLSVFVTVLLVASILLPIFIRPAYAATVVTLNAIDPQYYKRGDTVYYSGTVSPSPPGTTVGIDVKDHLGALIHHDQPTVTGGAFSGSFVIGSSGAEGLWTIYAKSGDVQDSKTFYLDATAPASSVSSPAHGSTVASVSTISGTASDTGGSGVASVAITIKRNSDNQYWTGSVWGVQNWLGASGTASWTYDASGVAWATGSYTIVSKATDTAGNVETPGAGNTFTLDMNEYSLTVNLVGTGSVTENPDNLHYHFGDSVQLTANPSPGWSFSAWSGGISGSVNPRTIIINGTTLVTATFSHDLYTVTLHVSGSGQAIANVTGPYVYGQHVRLTATADPGWTFASWSGGLSGNPVDVTIVGNLDVTATFTWNAPAVTVDGAYHGARVGWTDVGALSYNIYYSSVNDPNGATQYATGLTNTTLNVRNLPSATWDKTCYYWVAAVGAGGEAPKSSWGAGSDKVWIYKVEIIVSSVVVNPAVPGDIKVTVAYRSRYLDGSLSVQKEIGEYLGPGTVGNVPNRPMTILTTGPVGPLAFLSEGGFSFETVSNGEVVSGSTYKAWIFLWNQLPSESGYWEAYSAKYEVIAITIT